MAIQPNRSARRGRSGEHHPPQSLQKAKDAGKDVEALRAKYVADYERTTVNANLSLEMGEIDAMIDPEQTRETIIESLKLLSSKKRVRKTTKHHGNQPL